MDKKAYNEHKNKGYPMAQVRLACTRSEYKSQKPPEQWKYNRKNVTENSEPKKQRPDNENTGQENGNAYNPIPAITFT